MTQTDDVVERLREYRADWHKRMGDVSALDAAIAEIERLREENARLRGAISWLEPPFVDDKTSDLELRTRVGFCVIDANRSAPPSIEGRTG